MKRYARFFAAILVIVMALSLSVYANGKVTYDGASRKFVFEPGTSESPTNLFENFQNVMPGDTLTEQIVIKNTSQNGSYIRLYLRALGAQEGTEELLSQMKLTVKQNGASTLFEAPADETAQLSNWVYLGAMHSGGEMTLDVTLEVPITMGAEFQNKAGYIDWEFKAEEIPRDPNVPQTGDTSGVFLYSALLICSLAALAIIIFLFVRTKKEKKQQEG